MTVAAWDRTGLERLFRYCARPIFASERLQWIDKDQRLVYRLPKPRPDGQTVLYLTPLEFLDKLAALIPPPRSHRHRYHGVLAPNAPLRQGRNSLWVMKLPQALKWRLWMKTRRRQARTNPPLPHIFGPC
ncbi:MAG: transposase [Nitrosomonadaceae bacterium]